MAMGPSPPPPSSTTTSRDTCSGPRPSCAPGRGPMRTGRLVERRRPRRPHNRGLGRNLRRPRSPGRLRSRPGLRGRPVGGKKPFPVWAIVLIIAAVVILAGGLFAAIFIPALVLNDQHAKANESAVKAGVHGIQVGIQTWAVDHQGQYPAASDMNQMTMSDYVDLWPTNPYTGAPMAQGTQAGDYFYEVTPDGKSFRLVGYGKGGKVIIDIGSDDSSI